MLDRVVEQTREEEVFLREDTPTEQRVEAAFSVPCWLVVSTRRAGSRALVRGHAPVVSSAGAPVRTGT